MFRPTEPRGDSLLISLCVKRRFAAVQPYCGVAKILLNVLSDKFLFTEEHITDIIKRTPVSIITVLCDRKYLIISLYFQPQFFFKYSFYLFERFPLLFF